jgi:hypothetical protein
MKTGMVLKGPNRWVELLVEALHLLLNRAVRAIPQFAGSLLLRLIVLTLQRAAVLEFPNAEVR